MAVTFNGGVVLGADSRTTQGSYIASRISDKIEPIHSRIFCLRTGVSSHTQALAKYVRNYLSQYAVNEKTNLPEVGVAARLFQVISYSNKDFLRAGIILAGWDEVSGPQVYEITLGGTLVQLPYAISGSGSGYIYGYCDSNWKEGMTEHEAIQFVKNSLSLAMSRDGSSGGIIRLAVVKPDGISREYVSQDNLPYRG
jgi:20S proteasome subunit beta 1